ncbi:MAG: hypothetical protein AAGA42_08660 [Actinomycetota bacterium]
MWADTITVRLDDVLVGVRPDTAATAERLRALLEHYVDDDIDDDVPPAFSVQLEEGAGPVRSLPNVRLGGRTLVRSRQPDDVLTALALLLGGLHTVRAVADPERGVDSAGRMWLHLRAFCSPDARRVVLVDATQPALVAHAALRRAEVRELPTWSVAVDPRTRPPMVHIPTPLPDTKWDAAAVAPPLPLPDQMELVGLVAVETCGHEATSAEEHARHLAEHHGHTAGGRIAKFATRNPTPQWFTTIDALATGARVHLATDEADAATAIARLLADQP